MNAWWILFLIVVCPLSLALVLTGRVIDGLVVYVFAYGLTHWIIEDEKKTIKMKEKIIKLEKTIKELERRENE
jgi:hypothetical protein